MESNKVRRKEIGQILNQWSRAVFWLPMAATRPKKNNEVQARAQTQCDIHPSYVGTWYSLENGLEHETTVSSSRWGEYSCVEGYVHPTENDAIDGRNSTMLMQKEDGSNNCYICMFVLWRTPNVLQYFKSDCFSDLNGFEYMCGGKMNIQQTDALTTLFRTNVLMTVDCASTLAGEYGFTLETPNGFCDSPNNSLSACQEIGSPYVDNEIFTMDFGRCPNVPSPFEGRTRFQCMGSWQSMMGGVFYKFAAVANVLERDNRDRYTCLITLDNQNKPDNTIRWGMSRFGECSSLRSLYEVPYRIVFHRSPPPEVLVTPKCNVPSFLSGSWLSHGIHLMTEFSVNDTHIHSFPKCTPGTTLPENAEDIDFYASCKETSDTRFMMSKYFLGNCDAELVCYNITLLIPGLVRLDVGKPYSYTVIDEYISSMDGKFEEVCSDQSFEPTDRYRSNVLFLNRLY